MKAREFVVGLVVTSVVWFVSAGLLHHIMGVYVAMGLACAPWAAAAFSFVRCMKGPAQTPRREAVPRSHRVLPEPQRSA